MTIDDQHDLQEIATLLKSMKSASKNMSIDDIKKHIISLVPEAKEYGYYNERDNFIGYLKITLLPKEILNDPWFREVLQCIYNTKYISPEDILRFIIDDVMPKVRRRLQGKIIEPKEYQSLE